MGRCVVCLQPRVSTSQGLAKPTKSTCMITAESVSMPQHAHTLQEHWIHVAMLTLHSWNRTVAKELFLKKIASLIPSYYDTRFESKRQTITTTVSKPSAILYY